LASIRDEELGWLDAVFFDDNGNGNDENGEDDQDGDKEEKARDGRV